MRFNVSVGGFFETRLLFEKSDDVGLPRCKPYPFRDTSSENQGSAYVGTVCSSFSFYLPQDMYVLLTAMSHRVSSSVVMPSGEDILGNDNYRICAKTVDRTGLWENVRTSSSSLRPRTKPN